MPGPVIGILTEDFRMYHDLISALKEMDIPFHSLSFSEDIPPSIGVIITSRAELPKVEFDRVVTADIGIQFAIHMARKLLSGKEACGEIVIGIDPGRRPGVAVIGDGTVLHTAMARDPEDVLNIVEIAILMYPAERVRVRIGHGSVTERNRIINVLAPLRLDTEIVDEKSTTNKLSRTADVDAAIEIAFSPGYIADRKYAVIPTDGELRDIQRRSRLQSGQNVTISRGLAEGVAKGRLTMDEALELQRRRKPRRGGRGREE